LTDLSSKSRVRAQRARLRAQGLRPVQIWVPDVTAEGSPGLWAEALRLVSSRSRRRRPEPEDPDRSPGNEPAPTAPSAAVDPWLARPAEPSRRSAPQFCVAQRLHMHSGTRSAAWARNVLIALPLSSRSGALGRCVTWPTAARLRHHGPARCAAGAIPSTPD